MNPGQIDLVTAQRLIMHSIASAIKLGLSIAVTITDRGGHIVICARMDESNYNALEASRRKAITASNYSVPTKDLLQWMSGPFFAHPLITNSVTALPDFNALPGGFPLMVNGICVGGFGIAGGFKGEDQELGEQSLKEIFPSV